MNSEILLRKFQGCIIGKCVGDALGFIVEGFNHELCTEYVNDVLKDLKIPSSDRLRSNYSFGQYSDDSQLARELMISLTENIGFNPKDYSKKIMEIFANKKIVGGGTATSKSASRLKMGANWTESGEPGPNAGNGTAMRVAPIGLFYHNNLDLLSKFAIQQGIITHLDEKCSAGSVIIASTIAYVLKTEKFKNNDLINHLISQITSISPLFSEELEKLKLWLMEPYEKVVKDIRYSGKPEIGDDWWDNISPYVIPTVLWSLYSFLKHKNSYMEAIMGSIKVGGDVDTTAAITGAISGVYLGIKAIPEIYASKIQDQGTWLYDDLISLTNDLYRKFKSNSE